ncbi:hypothetical protein ACIPLC_27665 [Kitasatospora sp. NPDC086801]|uniref:hypothetical protein n=1 Tax=Kitasatospora sp. NPDC086801 TaxID=3364066 RepID=UPI00381D93C9
MTSQHSLNARLLRLALTLYPSSYGTGALAEVADLAGQRIARSGSAAGLREVADVAGHGARLRLGMVSHRPPGRAFATAAPLAAMLAGTYAATYLWRNLWLAISPEFLGFPAGVPTGGPLLAATSLLVPVVLTACAVVAGRWSAARALALVSLVLAPLFYALCRFGMLDLDFRTAAELGLGPRGFGAIVLNTLVLLVAPRDRTHRTGAGLWLVAAAVTALGIGATISSESAEQILTSGFGTWAPIATGAALAFTARTAGNAVLTGAVLAAPPVLTPVLFGGHASVVAMLPQLLIPSAFGYLMTRSAILLIGRLPRRGRLSRP